jgi:quinol monooxygenase YgiN
MDQGGRIVIVGYRPHPGQREALRRLMAGHVPALRAQQLVTDRPPITMEAKDGTIVEIFEWVSAAAIEAAHTNPAVLAMWDDFGKVCDYVPVAQIPEAAEIFSEFTPLPAGAPPAAARGPSPPPRFVPPAEPRPRPPTNEFGDPPDTLYAGGTPLFDETGQTPPGKRKRR